jgi:hypothetical protein
LLEIAKYLQTIDDWCKKNNKKFYFFIAPDKEMIYPEYFPYFIKEILLYSERKTQQLIKYLQENTDMKIIYPVDLLKNHKKDGLLYWIQDDHWNELGAYWGYFALVQEISKDFNIKPTLYKNLKETHYHSGGIINIEDNKTIYWVPDIKEEYIVTEYEYLENKNEKYKIAIIRDSFSTLMLPYLGNTFKKVSNFWRTVRSNDLDYIKENADIVIFEIIERALDSEIKNYVFPQEEK